MRHLNKTLLCGMIFSSSIVISAGHATTPRHQCHQYKPLPSLQQTIQKKEKHYAVTSTIAGATYGAIAGAALGGFVNGTPGVGSLIGAGVGLVTGALHAQAHHFKGYDVSTVTLDDYVILLMPTDKLFEPNNDYLLHSSYRTLNLVARYLKHFPNGNIHISGNTDQIVRHTSNLRQDLSTRRAMKIAGYMWSHGVRQGPYHRDLTYSGNGSNYPIATNKKLYGMALNRRIQITVYPRPKTCPDQCCSKNKTSCC